MPAAPAPSYSSGGGGGGDAYAGGPVVAAGNKVEEVVEEGVRLKGSIGRCHLSPSVRVNEWNGRSLSVGIREAGHV